MQVEGALNKIAEMKKSLEEAINTSRNVIITGKDVQEDAGATIAAYFGSLSDAALEVAMRGAFEQFDTDSSGEIDPSEFEEAMKQMGLRLSSQESAALFSECDEDGSGSIEFKEFATLVKTVIARWKFNSLHKPFRHKWCHNQTVWGSAASLLQQRIIGMGARERLQCMRSEERSHQAQRECDLELSLQREQERLVAEGMQAPLPPSPEGSQSASRDDRFRLQEMEDAADSEAMRDWELECRRQVVVAILY